jgi:hypothetical protein
MVIPLPCALSSFFYTWSSCPSYFVHLHHDHHFICPCTISLWSCGHHSLPHTPSSHVLLMPNSKHLTHDISNLVSLITKTKLGFSSVRIRVWIFNIRYRIRIRIFKSHIYDVDIQSYHIRHFLYYSYLNPNPDINMKTNMISVVSVRIRSVFIPRSKSYISACHITYRYMCRLIWMGSKIQIKIDDLNRWFANLVGIKKTHANLFGECWCTLLKL